MRALSISPDGKRVALSAYEHGNLDVWIHDLERPVKTRLTFDPGNDLSAQWSPLGKEIAFYSVRSGESLDIWLQAADGSSEAQPLAKTPLIEIPTSWSRDGSMLFFSRIDPKTGYDIWFIQRKPDGSWQEPVAFLQSEFNEMNAQISRDGRFVLYTSDQTGRIEIFVRSFPEGGYWQVSAQGGEQPRWSRDGREILYVENRDTLVSVPVWTTGVFSKGAATTLFRNAGLVRLTEANYMYDLSPDGKRILIAEPVEGDTVRPPAIHVIQNWPAMLRNR
jgi:Tol biopolymer transport system component